MKFLNLILILLSLSLITTGCGKRVYQIKGVDGKDGTNGVDGVNGQDGEDGQDGLDGQDGQDGESCSIESRAQGDFVLCGDDETQITFNEPEDVIELVVLCPKIAGSYPETLLNVNGEYLAFLTDSNYMRMRLISLADNVTFMTTDGRSVLFKIVNGEIVYLTAACN